MKRYLLLVVLCLAAVSCDQDTNFYVTPDHTSFVIGPEGGTFDDVLFTNGSWTCTVSDESVTVTPMSGDYTTPFRVVVGENKEMFTKAISIQFKSTLDDLSRTGKVVITQDCHPFVYCAEPVQTIGAAGGAVRFSVNSNEPWAVPQVDDIPGFSVSPLSGGPNSTIVTVTVPANDMDLERHFAVSLHLTSDPSVSQLLTVIQSVK